VIKTRSRPIVEDLAPLVAIGEELGELLAKRAVAALESKARRCTSYGKAAAGAKMAKLEHRPRSCIRRWSTGREVLGKGRGADSVVEEAGGPGHTTLDIPLGQQERHSCEGLSTAWNADQRSPARHEIMVAVASPTAAGRCAGRAG